MEYGIMPVSGVERPFIPLREDEFAALRSAKTALLTCLAVEEAFDFVVENYVELERALLDVALSHMVHADSVPGRANEDRGLFDRRLMNWLTAVKSYVDRLTRLATAISEEVGASAKAAMEGLRERAHGLGGMLAIRNYIQHHDSVVNSITYGTKSVGGTPGSDLAFSVTPIVDLTALRIDALTFANDRKMLTELRSASPRVDLIPLARVVLEDLWGVHDRVRSRLVKLAEDNEQLLAASKARYREAHSDLPDGVGLAAVAREPDQDPSEEVHLVWSFSDHRRRLEAKNAALGTISVRFVTNQARQ